MSYDYASCKKCLEYLFGLGATDPIDFQVRFRMDKTQVPLSGEENGHQNYFRSLVFHLCGDALKEEPASGEGLQW
ncbi:hypothetical protein TNCV_2470771 [Trichonephila clavipes]|nr:hypothetical protein TNCV_2470771 [Trichonephila clavipes]